jgi:hypothetical protein
VREYPSRGEGLPNVAPNPLVEPVREGFCVRSAWPNVEGGIVEMWNAAVGWTEDRTKAWIFSGVHSARTVARISSGVITTVPRHNGYCVEWTVVEDFGPGAVTQDV